MTTETDRRLAEQLSLKRLLTQAEKALEATQEEHVAVSLRGVTQTILSALRLLDRQYAQADQEAYWRATFTESGGEGQPQTDDHATNGDQEEPF